MRTPRLSILAGLLLFMPAAAGAWPWSKQLTKEQVVKEGLERYQEVHDDFAKKYPKNPEWLVQLKTAQTYFKEQSDAYLKQDLPYRQEELWRLKRVINEQIRGEQNAIEIYRQGQRRGEKAEETQQKVEAARQVAALKIQTAAMPEMPKDASAEKPGAEMGHGVASTAGDLLASGSRNPDGHVSPVDRVWRGRVEASSLVVNLGLASVECAQNAEKCVPPKPLPPIPPNPPVDPAPVSSLPVNPTNPVATPGTPQPVQPLPNAPGGQEPAIPIVLPPNWHQNAADTATGPGATNGMITGGALAAKRGDYSLAMSLAKAALSSNPGNQDALALMHSVKGRADAIDAGAAGRASAAATAAALAAGARDPGATGEPARRERPPPRPRRRSSRRKRARGGGAAGDRLGAEFSEARRSSGRRRISR
ncbi:MAG: hypothetical protein M0D55_14700 [Elusimicrobiota bacterium]|nr:MAG: hypothetical protein M0D55_14700 [Elusimicrobiota bacterium]